MMNKMKNLLVYFSLASMSRANNPPIASISTPETTSEKKSSTSDTVSPSLWHRTYENELPDYIYEPPFDYVIGIIIQPCGVNETKDKSLVDGVYYNTLGYDCCMNKFGMGEYGFLKSVVLTQYQDTALLGSRIPNFRQLARHDEILNNIDLVDERGATLSYKNSRRSDDETFVDYSCRGERDPFLHCMDEYLGARRSKMMAPCWDNNQTVYANLECYSVDGHKLGEKCMQFAYIQNALVHTCGGIFSNDTECGTYVEVHRRNGSPYDHEDVVLAETKITETTNYGMITTTIPLTYKTQEHKNRTLCAYVENKVRVGSMVFIKKTAPHCCCPKVFSQRTQLGSFFCPRRQNTKDGPFAGTLRTKRELYENDKLMSQYPFCHHAVDSVDELMCSAQSDSTIELTCNDDAVCKEQGRFYTYPCRPVIPQTTRTNTWYTSPDLAGIYPAACPLGELFRACALKPPSETFCRGSDDARGFRDEVGKVAGIPKTPNGTYNITFNDGRTTYNFRRSEFELIKPDSNYELWWVQRRGRERKVRYKKSFRVIHPKCTFDTAEDQYLPFALYNPNGEFVASVPSYNQTTVLSGSP